MNITIDQVKQAYAKVSGYDSAQQLIEQGYYEELSLYIELLRGLQDVTGIPQPEVAQWDEDERKREEYAKAHPIQKVTLTIEEKLTRLDSRIETLKLQKQRIYSDRCAELMAQLKQRGISRGTLCRHMGTEFVFASLECQDGVPSGKLPVVYNLMAHHQTPTGKQSKKTYFVGIVINIDEITKV